MKRHSILILPALFLILKAGAQSTNPAPYCAADFDGSVPDAIFNVSFGTLSNPTNAQFAAPHYVFYNNLAQANFSKGSTYTLTVVFDVHGSSGYGVWIDYNQNNVFEMAEKVSGSTGNNYLAMTPSTTVSQSITIPATALPGTTRMRIRIVEDDGYTGTNGASILACNASSSSADVMDWGETEDYAITIVASTVGLTELSHDAAFSIYPNPVSGLLTLTKDVTGDAEYQVSDLMGKSLQAGVLNGLEKQISVSTLPDGAYLLQLQNSNGFLGRQKFIKISGEDL